VVSHVAFVILYKHNMSNILLSLSLYRLLSLYFYMLTDVVSHVAFVILYKHNMSNMLLSLSFYRLLSLYFYMLLSLFL
jgi:hypothetical protein